MRKKNAIVAKVKDDGEDTGVTCTLQSVDLALGELLDLVIVCGPHDVDGEALLRLRENGFDFSKPRLIEFSVDFRSWPPRHGAMKRLLEEYPSTLSCGIDGDRDGYLEFQVYARLSYELVTNIKSYVTELMAPYQGACASWAIVQKDPFFG